MPEWVELWRKTGQRGLLITSYKRAITPAAEAVHVPANLVLPGSLQAKQLHYLHTHLSLGQSCHRQKNVLSLCVQVHFGSVQHFVAL